MFIDLLKAFYTIGNSILLKTLEQYGITDKNHGWVKLHLNDLKNASKILDPMMVASDSNIFFTHQDIRYLLQIINQELENIHQPMVYFK